MKTQFTRLRGMADLLPASITSWQHLEHAVRDVMHAYAYGEMRTPLLERTKLFSRSIGEATDIVEKEMYTFPDRHDELLTLRPENTAGCVRAAIENGLLQPGSVNRIWYTGPMFRYERPQLGRQRQFHQTGAEVYGIAGPEIEAELILLSARLWRELGILDALQLEINTLGTPDDRLRYRDKLVAYFQSCESQLDEDSQRRLQKNPLRILDSKNPDMQGIIEQAPVLRDSLSDDSAMHFDQLQKLLRAAGLTPVENSRLVRGLDYYSHTVFEWTTEHLGSQSAVCAGGRYDGLLEQLGARNMPGVGWAFGMERVLALLDTLDKTPAAKGPDVFVMATNDVPFDKSIALAEWLRELFPDRSIMHNVGAGSLKSQFRKADKSGAVVAVVAGSEELQQDTLTLKPLLSGADQIKVARADVQAELSALLGSR